MLLKKKKSVKTKQNIVDDMKYSFNKIISHTHPILSITINNTNCKSTEELRFFLTNKLFNKINKEYKPPFVLNYLYVIEYPTAVSKGNIIPAGCKVHTHIVLATTIPEKEIENYIKDVFINSHIYIDNITNRNDKRNYINYLTKQSNLLTNDSYNYKILL